MPWIADHVFEGTNHAGQYKRLERAKRTAAGLRPKTHVVLLKGTRAVSAKAVVGKGIFALRPTKGWCKIHSSN